MSESRSKRDQFCELLKKYLPDEKASEVADYFNNSITRMLREEHADISQVENLGEIITEIVNTASIPDYLAVIKELENESLALFAAENIKGPIVSEKIKEYIEELNNQTKQGKPPSVLPSPKKLQDFFFPVNHDFALDLAQRLIKFEDKRIHPINEKYSAIKDMLRSIWDEDIDKLETMCAEQSQGLTRLENDLWGRFEGHVNKEAINLEIALDSISSDNFYIKQREEENAKEEFKKNLNKAIDNVFDHWIEDKLPEVKSHFQKDFPRLKASRISLALSNVETKQLSKRVKDIIAQREGKGDQKGISTSYPGGLFGKCALVESVITEGRRKGWTRTGFSEEVFPEENHEIIWKFNKEVCKINVDLPLWPDKISVIWDIPTYSTGVVGSTSRNLDLVNSIISFFESNKISYLTSLTDDYSEATTFYIPMTQENLLKMDKAVFKEEGPKLADEKKPTGPS